jgi:hypothetical protein
VSHLIPTAGQQCIELRRRKPGQDFRRILFANQLGLVAALDETWARREDGVMADTLVEHPFT